MKNQVIICLLFLIFYIGMINCQCLCGKYAGYFCGKRKDQIYTTNTGLNYGPVIKGNCSNEVIYQCDINMDNNLALTNTECFVCDADKNNPGADKCIGN